MTQARVARRGRSRLRGYLLIAGLGMLTSVAVDLAFPDLRQEARLLAFALTVAALVPLTAVLGRALAAVQQGADRHEHGEDDVEVRWFQQACSLACLDLVVLSALAAGVLTLLGAAPPIGAVLLAVVGALALDVWIRYLVLARDA